MMTAHTTVSAHAGVAGCSGWLPCHAQQQLRSSGGRVSAAVHQQAWLAAILGYDTCGWEAVLRSCIQLARTFVSTTLYDYDPPLCGSPV